MYKRQIWTSRILRYDPKSGVITDWRTGINRCNGLAYDAQGRLFGCCSGGRSIVRFDADNRNTVIADRVDGKRLNTPNDLAIDRKIVGRVEPLAIHAVGNDSVAIVGVESNDRPSPGTAAEESSLRVVSQAVAAVDPRAPVRDHPAFRIVPQDAAGPDLSLIHI